MFNILKLGITGNIIYALYIGLLIGFLTSINHILLPFSSINLSLSDVPHIFYITQWFSSFVYAVIAICLYLIGESFAWGKWDGSLCHPENITDKVKNSKCGKSFPYIHYIANYIQNQDKNYKLYCQIALTIRGFIWWTPLMILVGYLDLLSWVVVIINSFVLAVGFPIACEIGKNINFECNYKYFHTSKGWCNQELIYGLIQFVCLSLSIFLTLYFN